MAKLTKEKRAAAIDSLLQNYPDAKCALDYDSTYHLLVAVVLSAQTTDVSVNKISPMLFAAAPTPKDMCKLSPAKLEKYIKSIGLYKNKAKNVLALSKDLCERFGGEVPDKFDDLCSLPGVGRKTANVVLSEAFGKQAIAVDTHVFRLANRIGFTKAENVLDTELQLQKAIPYELWTKMHHALIWHGRKVCTARNPKCEECCLNGICKKNGLL